ncbi:MAG: LPS export ABC transporter ATP-binding protein, partial [Limnochordia bacterium]
MFVCQNLVKNYRGRLVLHGISLEVAPGRIVGLLGPNGAGKTTTFRLLVGLERADAGQIFLDDQEITSLPMPRRGRLGLSYLAQEPSIFRKMTVEENIRAVLEMVEPQARLEELLETFNLTHLRDQGAHTLSGGERRRTELARALAGKPRYLLLDEPFAGIDPIAIADLQKLIAYLKDLGLGVLITDHNVRETLSIVDE